MKKTAYILICALLALGLNTGVSAQAIQDSSSQTWKVIKQNGVAFTGKIVSQDAREVLIDSKEIGLVYVPKHEIREIVEIKPDERGGSGSLFSTRYFLTTNGFPIKKGDNYIQWNLFGPDFQFGIADHFGVGVMTSWVGMPVIGTAKYSLNLGKNLCGGLGFLGGTGSWAYPKYGLLLPFGFLTIGNRTNNINFSAGYGALFQEVTKTTYELFNEPIPGATNSYSMQSGKIEDSQGRFLCSVAGMFRLNSKFSFVFDSFIMIGGEDKNVQSLVQTRNETTGLSTYAVVVNMEKAYPLVVVAPGLRFQATENSSFQFGFTGIHYKGEFVPLPIPMIQWFRKI